MMFDSEICIYLTEGNSSLGHANPFSMDLSVIKVTTRLQTGMIENEILCQLMTMRSKRTGELFKQDIYDSECGGSGDIYLRVVVELWKDYHGKQKKQWPKPVFEINCRPCLLRCESAIAHHQIPKFGKIIHNLI